MGHLRHVARDGVMKHGSRSIVCAAVLLCGCAGRVDTDLLRARIREQASELTESQREIAKVRSELKQSQLEAAQLKSELGQSERLSDEPAQMDVPIRKIHIFPLASGGLNKDESPGDDAVVVQFVPMDRDNEPIKQPGDVAFTLIDPRLPDSERELGQWKFSTDECRKHWTRGITSTGYQFTLPLEQSPQHPEVVVHLRFTTPQGQRYEMNQIVKVAVSKGQATARVPRARKIVRPVAEPENPLPPVGNEASATSEAELPDWAQDEKRTRPPKLGSITRHSANWTDATIPVLR